MCHLIAVIGIIAYSYGTAFILNSYNTGSINTVKNNAGGIIAQNNNNSDTNNAAVIINSYNTGTTTVTDGIVANGITSVYTQNTTNIQNVYNIGKATGTGGSYGVGYLANNLTYTVNNVYYNSDVNNVGSNQSNVGTAMSQTNMKNQSFVEILNRNMVNLNLETIDSRLKGFTLSYWQLGEDGYPTFAKDIKDLSGNGNNGINQAVRIDSEGLTTGTDSSHTGYVNLGLMNYDFKDSLSFVCRVKFNSISNQYFFGNWEGAGGGLYLSSAESPDIALSLFVDNEYKYVYANKKIAANEWHTIIGLYDGSLEENNIKIYLDGVDVTRNNMNVKGNVKAVMTPILIGANPRLTFPFYNPPYDSPSYSTFKEVLVFDRALTEEKDKISINYKDNINVINKDELLLWYKF